MSKKLAVTLIVSVALVGAVFLTGGAARSARAATFDGTNYVMPPDLTLENNFDTDRLTLTGSITGTGDLYINQSGNGYYRITTEQGLANTFVGNVFVRANQFQVSTSESIPDGALVDTDYNGGVNPAALRLVYNVTETIAGLTGNSNVFGDAGGGILRVGFGGASSSSHTNLYGDLELVKIGSGTMTATNSLAPNRGFNIQDGVLELQRTNMTGGKAVTVSGGGAMRVGPGASHMHYGAVTLSGGILDTTATVGSWNSGNYLFDAGVTVAGSSASYIRAKDGVHLGANTLFTVNDAVAGPGADLIVEATLRRPGAAAGFTKQGAGTMLLTGGAGLDALLVDGGTVALGGSATYDFTSIRIADSAAATLAIQDTAAVNNTGSLLVGETGGIGGAVEQTGGTFTIAGETRIGHWPNETSTYTLGNGSLVSNGDFNVGWDGLGAFTQNGGDSQFNAGLDVGAHAGAGATVTVNGGTMTTTDIMLGDYSGTAGTMNQTGGTVTITGSTGENAAIRIGHWPSGNTSAYNLSGGNFSITMADQDLGIGTDGNGVFHQTGGQADVPGVQVNHRNANGSGTLIVEGTGVMNIGARGLKVAAGTATLGGNSVTTVTGNVSVGDWNFAGTNTLTIEGNATLHANGAEFMVGDSNGVPGAVSQTGGTVNIAGRTRIGHWPNNTSTYTLGGGALTSSGEFNVGWDGTGILTQAAGTSTFTGQVHVNRRGTVNMEGGVMTTNDGLRVGFRSGDSTALFNMKGGALNANWIGVGDQPNNGGTFHQTGGDVSLTNWLRVGHWSNNTSTYNMDGGTLTLTGSGTGAEQAGVVTLGVDGTGILNHNAGTISTRGVYLDARGATAGIDQYNLTGGVLEINSGLGIAGNADTSTYQVNLGGGTVKSNASWSRGTPMTLTGTGGNVTFDVVGGQTVTLTGLLSGPGGLVKDGAGILRLTQSGNSYAGGTVVDGGTLELQGANNGQSTVGLGTITINPGATVTALSHNVFGHTTEANIPHIAIVGGTLNPNAYMHVKSVEMTGGLISLDTSASGSGLDWSHTPRSLVSHASATQAEIAAKMTINGGNLNADVEDGAPAVDMLISGQMVGNGGLVKTGAGTLALTNTNTYTGGTTVDGGTLELSRPGNSSTGTIRGVLTINNGGIVRTTTTNSLGWGGGAKIDTLNINEGSLLENVAAGDQGWGLAVNLDGGELRSNGGVSSAAGQYFSLGGGSSITSLANANGITSVVSGRINLREGNPGGMLTFNVADGPATVDLLVSAAITQQNGAWGIEKTGDGTMALNGASTYTGATEVRQGTLAGVGSLAGPLNVHAATLAPGQDGPGIFQAGTTTFVVDSFFDVQLMGADAGTEYDQLGVTGEVHLNDATLSLLLGYLPAEMSEFVLIDNDRADAVFGTFDGLQEGDLVYASLGSSAQAFQISYAGRDGNDVVLTAVPEPVTLSLLAMAGVGLGGYLRRRRRASRNDK